VDDVREGDTRRVAGHRQGRGAGSGASERSFEAEHTAAAGARLDLSLLCLMYSSVALRKYCSVWCAQVVAFIDELNTAPTSVLAAIKECFVDGTYCGEALPPNIFWAGAINPPNINARPSAAVPPIRGSATDSAEFIVRNLPMSLQSMVLDFHTMTDQQELQFIDTMVGEAP
jgi:hypothetical protein